MIGNDDIEWLKKSVNSCALMLVSPTECHILCLGLSGGERVSYKMVSRRRAGEKIKTRFTCQDCPVKTLPSSVLNQLLVGRNGVDVKSGATLEDVMIGCITIF